MQTLIRQSIRIFSTFALCLGMTSFGLAGDAPAHPGLRGILPDFVPAGLYEDDFLTLGESWNGWSVGVAAEVAKLYEDFELDAAAQRVSIETLQIKIRTMEKALADPDYTAIHVPLATLRARLQPRVDLAEAVLDTLEGRMQTASTASARDTRSHITQAVDELEEYLSSVPDGTAWLDYVQADRLRQVSDGKVPLSVVSDVRSRLSNPRRMKTDQQRRFLKRPAFVQLRQQLDRYLDRQQRVVIRTVADGDDGDEALRETLWTLVDSIEQYTQTSSVVAATAAHRAFGQIEELSQDKGHRIAGVLAEHYFNDNLRVVVSEAFLSRVVGYSFEETGDVDDFVLGAKINGKQTTTGTVSVDLRPGEDMIQFYMRLDGITRSNTFGRTNQATVTTVGYHTFAATKSISFNGDVFRTAPGEISVDANNTTTSARTTVSRVLIFGPLADGIALREARRRKQRSEAIAADRVRQRVLPEFNKGIEAEFAKLTTSLETKVNPMLLDADLYPSRRSFTSTNDELLVRTRLMDTQEFGGNAATLVTTGKDVAVIHLHESLINNAINRLALRSLEMTEAELIATLADSLSGVLGESFKLPAPDADDERKPDNTKFVFPDEDVLRVKLDAGVLTIILRAGLKPEKGDEIPTQEISIPLTFSISDGKLQIDAESPSVSPVDPPSSPFAQIARAGVVKSKIQAALPSRTVDAVFTIERETGGPVELKISQILPNAGWLSIVIQ